jgi:hypothetical protein
LAWPLISNLIIGAEDERDESDNWLPGKRSGATFNEAEAGAVASLQAAQEAPVIGSSPRVKKRRANFSENEA